MPQSRKFEYSETVLFATEKFQLHFQKIRQMVSPFHASHSELLTDRFLLDFLEKIEVIFLVCFLMHKNVMEFSVKSYIFLKHLKGVLFRLWIHTQLVQSDFCLNYLFQKYLCNILLWSTCIQNIIVNCNCVK